MWKRPDSKFSRYLTRTLAAAAARHNRRADLRRLTESIDFIHGQPGLNGGVTHPPPVKQSRSLVISRNPPFLQTEQNYFCLRKDRGSAIFAQLALDLWQANLNTD